MSLIYGLYDPRKPKRITNSVESRHLPLDQPMPEGWKFGRTFKKRNWRLKLKQETTDG